LFHFCHIKKCILIPNNITQNKITNVPYHKIFESLETYNERGKQKWERKREQYATPGSFLYSSKFLKILQMAETSMREECEEKLAELIREMKAEIAEMKKAANV